RPARQRRTYRPIPPGVPRAGRRLGARRDDLRPALPGPRPRRAVQHPLPHRPRGNRPRTDRRRFAPPRSRLSYRDRAPPRVPAAPAGSRTVRRDPEFVVRSSWSVVRGPDDGSRIQAGIVSNPTLVGRLTRFHARRWVFGTNPSTAFVN